MAARGLQTSKDVDAISRRKADLGRYFLLQLAEGGKIVDGVAADRDKPGLASHKRLHSPRAISAHRNPAYFPRFSILDTPVRGPYEPVSQFRMLLPRILAFRQRSTNKW